MLTYFYIEHFYIYFCYLSASAIFLRLVEHFHFFRYKKICKKKMGFAQSVSPLPLPSLNCRKAQKRPLKARVLLLLYNLTFVLYTLQ